ncbi:DNA gyrase subunit B [Candidatus Falkowbacteria bacterium RIFOXYB2_FULL_34_18]|uniref:DNA gyrase subunit B n=1 Tax=Candidatus Falkowbacteria bacterium RIFOXYD2_FULL_34_120 TaxID=1798007 RepID=A0A1F5TPC6_9BACT|nr:MAG: DNA gyrase subunit B [Candidatus Falkowbacteria bacterium RIFOXYC12_FULL_34_55]OGF28839.1 MAG: DNA gyrase subunit B [Candidatus Falkowbacteria bacterium RIFOXYB2_FULL_34_18]OGF38391.1 MAG: DNA gyrase subunit B [Candidatus Falkowbacteria bacterium RIFOXYD12_FULL_34_57]OGF40381.1 MAG: DNA gyrase subunit B [Candidatus Falkowbacteria bacterium RIFOXYD2_FULL_34_120]
MANKDNIKKAYGADSITVLEGLDPVRKRPGMYIGSTSSTGLHHLIWEVVDNGIDEAMGGYATEITVSLLDDNMVEVTDNGRGIPVDIHKVTKVSALETIMTTLHAGGKFGGEDSGYKTSSGLHGVGVSVVNALSDYVKAEIHKDGKIWVQEYNRGKPLKKVKPIGPTKKTGTIITFKPDATIFADIEFHWDKIINHLRQQAYLNKGLTMKIYDKRKDHQKKEYTFHFEGGIKSYIKSLNRNRTPKNETIFYVDKDIKDSKVEVALQYNDEYNEVVLSFANNIYNMEGGTHLIGFRSALTRTLNTYARNQNLLKEKEPNLTGEDVREGLTAIISVKITEPQFEGQTKGKLGNAEVKGYVEQIFGEYFATFLEEHPKEGEAIIGKCILSSQARLAARTARATILRKSALDGITLPGKLADCSSRKAEECELYIVEGDSAGGSAKQGRDRKFQAILPLRGKILNVERARLDKMLANNEIKNLVIAMGTNIDDQFNLEKLRYHRIIIMTDADVDGAHIRTLLLTLFFRHFTPLVTGGHLYVAQPPLYQLKKGNIVKYVYSDTEKEKVIKEMGGVTEGIKEESEEELEETTEEQSAETDIQDKNSKNVKIKIQRYKGLGEMNPEQLWSTTMDPKTRIMSQVTIEDAARADEVFDMLMGGDVAPRKKFIQTHAKAVQNLDI